MFTANDFSRETNFYWTGKYLLNRAGLPIKCVADLGRYRIHVVTNPFAGRGQTKKHYLIVDTPYRTVDRFTGHMPKGILENLMTYFTPNHYENYI